MLQLKKDDPNVSNDVEIAVAVVAHPAISSTIIYPISKQLNILTLGWHYIFI